VTAMKTKKWIIIALTGCLGLGAAFLLFWFFSGDVISPGKVKPAQQPPLTDAKTVRASIETVTEWYDAVGTVQPRTRARIEARITGQITGVRVDAGDPVKEGELLVVLDDRQLQARLSQARQSLKTATARKEQAGQSINAAEAAFIEAQSAYKRVKNFFNAGAATEQDLEQARSRFLQAESALKRAKDAFSEASSGVVMAEEMIREAKIGLSYTKINAPADGEVLKRLVDPGDLAVPGKPLLLLQTAGGLRLEAHVRESLIQKVHPGAMLRVELATMQKTVDAKVGEIIPYADPQTRTFLVKARLPDLPGLYPGMYGKLLIPYKALDLVLIPKTAIEAVGQLELVMVKTRNGWERRYIKTGNVYGDKVEVLSGLSGGETLKARGRGNGQ